MDEQNKTEEQVTNKPKGRTAEHLKPWQYKKGVSGNPNGRPKGSVSLKQYIKNKIAGMTPEEKEEYLDGIDKYKIWEMAEDKPQANTDIKSGGKEIQGVVILPAKDNENNTDTTA